MFTSFGFPATATADLASASCPAWPSAQTVDAPEFLIGQDAVQLLSAPTILEADEITIDGQLLTADATVETPAAGLCVVTERLTIGPAGLLCTGDGLDQPLLAQRTSYEPLSAPAGTNGGPLLIRLTDLEHTPEPPSLTILPGGVLCTGDGGDGSPLFLMDATLDSETLTCSPIPNPPASVGLGGDGGDSGILSLAAPAAAILNLPPGTLLGGRGGSGGTVWNLGNPRGAYHAYGGDGGDSQVLINGVIPQDLAWIGASIGGDGGSAYAAPCPEDAPPSPSPATDPSWVAASFAVDLCQQFPWLADQDACVPTQKVPTCEEAVRDVDLLLDDSTEVKLNPDCEGTWPPPPPPPCGEEPLLPCLLNLVRDVCYRPIPDPRDPFGETSVCAILDEISDESAFGGPGEGVTGNPSPPGSGGNGYQGQDGAFTTTYSFGASMTASGPGVNASVQCAGSNTPATPGGDGTGNALNNAGQAGGAGGGRGAFGLLMGGTGGTAHLNAADGGYGGDGGKGGNGAATTCPVSFATEDGARGGRGGDGGKTGGGGATGGTGGNSTFQPGRGGDASASGGTGGTGGNGGDGGDGAVAERIICFGTVCHVESRGVAQPGEIGCFGGGGPADFVEIQGGAGGISTLTGLPTGAPGSPEAGGIVVGTAGQQGQTGSYGRQRTAPCQTEGGGDIVQELLDFLGI